MEKTIEYLDTGVVSLLTYMTGVSYEHLSTYEILMYIRDSVINVLEDLKNK